MSPRVAGIAGLGIRLTHPDKLYWPEEGYTKRDLVAYYAAVFPRLRPWVRDRMLALERCPEGMRGTCFFQKEKPTGLPAATRTQKIAHQSRATNYVVGGSRATQLALANLGVIAIHLWNARAAAPRQPDWLCFDLDPPDGRFAAAVQAAWSVRELLDRLGLMSYPKTTGGKGLHVFVPLRRGPDADVVLGFARRVSERLARDTPESFTVEIRKQARGGRLYLDAQRNAFAQTVVAPYSVRHRRGATISTPLAWSEVDARLDPAAFHLGNFLALRRGDPWADFFRNRQSLTAALRTLESLPRSRPRNGTTRLRRRSA
jgi:bifunctional non-homologous end joining protein LigD